MTSVFLHAELDKAPTNYGWVVITEYLEFHDDEANSHKFYEISLCVEKGTTDTRVVRRWGRVGSEGSSRMEMFSTPYDGAVTAANLAQQKNMKGYVTDKVTVVGKNELYVPMLERMGVNPYRVAERNHALITPQLLEHQLGQAQARVFCEEGEQADRLAELARVRTDVANVKEALDVIDTRAEFLTHLEHSKMRESVASAVGQ